MKKIVVFTVVFLALVSLIFAQEKPKARVLIMISEQNIEGPTVEWWLSEIDLSVTETVIAQALIDSGYEVVDTSLVNKIIKQTPAFRRVNLSSAQSVELGKKSKVDFVILGKAIASAKGKVPDSNMVSCHANITGKVIRVKDSKVIAYFDGRGTSVHMDVVSGGSEALAKAGNYVATKIVAALDKQYSAE
jgi:hypothetical protein